MYAHKLINKTHNTTKHVDMLCIYCSFMQAPCATRRVDCPKWCLKKFACHAKATVFLLLLWRRVRKETAADYQVQSESFLAVIAQYHLKRITSSENLYTYKIDNWLDVPIARWTWMAASMDAIVFFLINASWDTYGVCRMYMLSMLTCHWFWTISWL